MSSFISRRRKALTLEAPTNAIVFEVVRISRIFSSVFENGIVAKATERRGRLKIMREATSIQNTMGSINF